MVLGVANREEMLKKIAEIAKKKRQKKMGTPKFAPGKGGGSDAARKGKGAIKKKPVPFKPKNGKQPERGKMAKGGRPGLYANIHAKRKSGKRMKKKGEKGAPTAANFRRAAQTARTR